jgi:two-component system, sensor histidine kinase PdtaS
VTTAMSKLEPKDYRSQARELHAKRDWKTEPVETERLIEELQIHQIELELQNQDLQKARKEAEAARDRYFLLFDMAPTAYLMVDSTGNIAQVNLKAAELLGRKRPELSGRSLPGYFEGKDADRVLFALESAANGRPFDEEWYALRPVDGATRYVNLRVVTWQEGEDGSPALLLVSIVDATEQKLRNDEQREAISHYRVLLRELNHRVKNNLMILSSIVELERHKGPTEETFDAIVQRIRGVALAHTAMHEAAKDVDAVDLNEMLKSVVESLRRQLPGRIECSFVRGPAELVLGSRRALTVSLAVNELITNALKHAFPDGRKGTIQIEISQVDERVHLTIADDGVGTDTSRPNEGAGIGTQLVMQFVDELGGTWEMTSPHEGGAGLRHDIEFPLE